MVGCLYKKTKRAKKSESAHVIVIGVCNPRGGLANSRAGGLVLPVSVASGGGAWLVSCLGICAVWSAG